MAPSLPKDYKVGVFKEKGKPLEFEQRPLEQPKDGYVSPVALPVNYNA